MTDEEKLKRDHKLLLDFVKAIANHELRCDEGDFYIKLARQTLETVDENLYS